MERDREREGDTNLREDLGSNVALSVTAFHKQSCRKQGKKFENFQPLKWREGPLIM